MNAPEPTKPARSLAATVAILAIGLVILVPSGLCTGTMGVSAVVNAVLYPAQAGDAVSMIALALIVGGPFVIAGGALVWIAIRRLRGR